MATPRSSIATTSAKVRPVRTSTNDIFSQSVSSMTFPLFTRPGLLHSLLGGWQISDLTSFQTGTPFSITNSVIADNAGTGNSFATSQGNSVQSYPDIVGNLHGKVGIRHPGGQLGPRLYNSDAFAAPQGLTYGNAGTQRSQPSRSHELRYGFVQELRRP